VVAAGGVLQFARSGRAVAVGRAAAGLPAGVEGEGG
jgi:hypothetical protein